MTQVPQGAASYRGADGGSKDKVPVTGMCLGCVNGRNVGEIASLHAHKRPNLTQTLVNFGEISTDFLLFLDSFSTEFGIF